MDAIITVLPIWAVDVLNLTSGQRDANDSRAFGNWSESELFAFCQQVPGEEPSVPFPSCYTWTQIILFALFMALVMMVIVFGNLVVIVSVLTNTSLKTVQNYLLVSLAVADCCVGALIMPFSLANELMGYWAFGDILCDSW